MYNISTIHTILRSTYKHKYTTREHKEYWIRLAAVGRQVSNNFENENRTRRDGIAIKRKPAFEEISTM